MATYSLKLVEPVVSITYELYVNGSDQKAATLELLDSDMWHEIETGTEWPMLVNACREIATRS